MIQCRRCGTAVSDTRHLESHLVEDHLMAAQQAKKEAQEAPGVAPAIAAEVAAGDSGRHECPKCGTKIECEWRAIGLMEEQAHCLKIMAGMWRAKLLGRPIGRPRKTTFDVEEARALVASGMSYRAVGRQLGAHPEQIRRDVNPSKRWS